MLLINPANREYGGTLSRFTPLALPMSIGCLASYLIQAGHEARIWDEEIQQLDESNIDEVVAGLPTPYVFGISVLTAQAARAADLAVFLKARFPGCTVMTGGYHATAVPDEMLAETLEFDFVVRGEGERALLTLYEAIRAGKTDFATIDGISYRRPDGLVTHTPEAALIKDLDTLPPFPYEMFAKLLERTKGSRTYDWGFIVTSRGCPYKCTYCSQRMMTGTTYRYKSPERIVDELRVLVEQFGARSVFFLDDNFCFVRSRTKAVCEALIASGLGKNCVFSLQTRADNFHADVAPLLKEAGFTSVGFGMEVGDDRLANLIMKGETVQRHVDAVNVARANGIEVALFMMFGIPTETHEDRANAFRLCNKLGVEHLKFNNLIPYPGTPIYIDIAKSGRMRKVGRWENFTSALAEMGMPFTAHAPLPYVPDGSSEWELRRDLIRFNLLASLRPRVLWAIVRRRHGPGWFKLRAAWYLRPSDLFRLSLLAIVMIFNLLVAMMPLFPLEGIAEWLDPDLQRRRKADPVPVQFAPTSWSRESKLKVLK